MSEGQLSHSSTRRENSLCNHSILKVPPWNCGSDDPALVPREHPLARTNYAAVERLVQKGKVTNVPANFNELGENDKHDAIEKLRIPTASVNSIFRDSQLDTKASYYRRVDLQCVYNHFLNRRNGEARRMIGVEPPMVALIERNTWVAKKGKDGLRGIVMMHTCPFEDPMFNYKCPGTALAPCCDNGASIALLGGGNRFIAVVRIIEKWLEGCYDKIEGGQRVRPPYPPCLEYLYRVPDGGDPLDDCDKMGRGLPVEIFMNPKHVGAIKFLIEESNSGHEDDARGLKTTAIDLIDNFPTTIVYAVPCITENHYDLPRFIRGAVSTNNLPDPSNVDRLKWRKENLPKIVRQIVGINDDALSDRKTKGASRSNTAPALFRLISIYLFSVGSTIRGDTVIRSPFSTFHALGILMRVCTDEELSQQRAPINFEMIAALVKGDCQIDNRPLLRSLPEIRGPSSGLYFSRIPVDVEKYFRWYATVLLSYELF
jgi:hypothetical protein